MSRRMDMIGVVGAGVMGVGVAQSAAEGGFQVVLVDHSPAALDKAARAVRANLRLKTLLKRLAPGGDIDRIMAQMMFTDDLDRLSEADLVVENIVEDWTAKQPIYEALDRICPPHCIFAANTSAIEIRRIAGTTSRASNVVGMHFMNPVPLKDTVEVIQGDQTSADTMAGAHAFLARMNMRAIVVNDSPGFVSNRVLMLTINEAICLVEEEVASAKDVDDIFMSCFGHKMGPLATADLIGLDTILLSLRVLQDSFGGEKYNPSSKLIEMVDSGYYGKKSGEGFYKYADSV